MEFWRKLLRARLCYRWESILWGPEVTAPVAPPLLLCTFRRCKTVLACTITTYTNVRIFVEAKHCSW